MQLGSVMHILCIYESGRGEVNEVTDNGRCVIYLLLGVVEIDDLEVKYSFLC